MLAAGSSSDARALKAIKLMAAFVEVDERERAAAAAAEAEAEAGASADSVAPAQLFPRFESWPVFLTRGGQ